MTANDVSNRIYLALGSNLGDRASHLAAARTAIAGWPDTEILTESRIYETEPVGPAGQGAYLNQVLAAATRLSPEQILEFAQKTERTSGRDRATQTVIWGPRTLDIDLLFYADLVRDDAGLTLPHPRLHERSFVLTPLAEITPDLVHPVLNQTVAELSRSVGSEGLLGVYAPEPIRS